MSADCQNCSNSSFVFVLNDKLRRNNKTSDDLRPTKSEKDFGRFFSFRYWLVLNCPFFIIFVSSFIFG